MCSNIIIIILFIVVVLFIVICVCVGRSNMDGGMARMALPRIDCYIPYSRYIGNVLPAYSDKSNPIAVYKYTKNIPSPMNDINFPTGLKSDIALEVEKVNTVTESKDFYATMMTYNGINKSDNEKFIMRGILRNDLHKLGINDDNTSNSYFVSREKTKNKIDDVNILTKKQRVKLMGMCNTLKDIT